MKTPRLNTTKRIVIRQVDLDTLVSAFILGCTSEMPLNVVPELATNDDLRNPHILCLECGGSGEPHRNNFDHHDDGCLLPPACVQALEVAGHDDEWIETLVDYTAAIDTGVRLAKPTQPQTLSGLISGVRLVHLDPKAAFHAGLEALALACSHRVDIYGPLPLLPQWQPFREARQQHQAKLSRDGQNALIFTAKNGLRWGFLESTEPGVHGLLRSMGCALTIAAFPADRDTGLRRISIATTGRRLDGLLVSLRNREKGWGGPSHGSIIASPFGGSHLETATILKVAENYAETETVAA